MGFFDNCWSTLLRLMTNAQSFHTLGGSPGLVQQPLRPWESPNQAQEPVANGVTFTPQNANIQCHYPNFTGWSSCNNANNRSCWLKGPYGQTFDINTDYEHTFPVGITREYWLNVSVDAIAPDGYLKPLGQVFNNTYPGPVLEACWGDELVVHVTNLIPNLGTTVHWHGIRQKGTNEADGVNGVTQCPIARNTTYTYRFRVEQYGHTWYHSHYQTQYSDGVMGGLTIYGPSSASFDEAWDPVLINDWIHENASVAFKQELAGAPPIMETLLLNGTGNFQCSDLDPNCCTSCVNAITLGATDVKCPAGVDPAICCIPDKRCLVFAPNGTIVSHHSGTTFTKVFQKGKRYLLRIVNSSAEAMFRFSIDGHDLQVIATDLVPIRPYVTDDLFIGIGQRYQVIVQAKPNAAAPDGSGNYWIRMRVATNCGSVQQGNEEMGIIRYNGASTSNPVTPSNNDNFACQDELPSNLRPVFQWDVTKLVNDRANFSFEAGMDTTITNSAFRWDLTDTPLFLNYSNPTILNTENNTYLNLPNNAVVRYAFEQAEDFVYLVITAQGIDSTKRKIPAAHPIHLHGHDFVILAQVDDTFNGTIPQNQVQNPTRRDVALLYSGGYLALAFKPDNPGVWLVHCHIAFHSSSGLALQVLERQADIPSTLTPAARVEAENACQSWDTFNLKFQQDDSGV